MTNKQTIEVSRELSPCPFCGSPATMEEYRLVWCVRCTKCSACVLGDRAHEPHGDGISSDEIQDQQAAEMSENTDWGAYEKSAVDTWNKRIPAQEIKQQGKALLSKGFTTLESEGGKYRIITVYQTRDDAWSDYKALCKAEQPAPVAVVLPELDSTFESWWESDGQYCRAGGGSYEKTFAYRAYEAALAETAKLNGLKP